MNENHLDRLAHLCGSKSRRNSNGVPGCIRSCIHVRGGTRRDRRCRRPLRSKMSVRFRSHGVDFSRCGGRRNGRSNGGSVSVWNLYSSDM